MNTIELLRQQLQSAHETMEATMMDVTTESAHFVDTGKALPVGAAYAHAVISEDVIVATMFAHTTPLSAGSAQTGLSTPMPSQQDWDKHAEWAMHVQVDIAKLKEFAKDVYAATDAYIATLKEEDLDTEMDMGAMGKKNLAWVFSNFVILHIANLTGEISAVKGVQGLKGYPF